MVFKSQETVNKEIRMGSGMHTLPAIAAASLPVLVTLAVIEWLTSLFSSALAKEICGQGSLLQYAAVAGEQSCRADVGVYFMALLVLLITVAMVVLLLSVSTGRA